MNEFCAFRFLVRDMGHGKREDDITVVSGG